MNRHVGEIFYLCRGGGGPDPSWHKYGSGMSKLNSISDFVSCGKYLLSEGFVHERRLGAVGVSAGSLLVAAAINMYPELFQAAILKVSANLGCFSVLSYSEVDSLNWIHNAYYGLIYSPNICIFFSGIGNKNSKYLGWG